MILRVLASTAAALSLAAATAAPAAAQPDPAAPQDAPPSGRLVLEGGLPQNAQEVIPGRARRRPSEAGTVMLGFRNERIESVIPFIVEWTGKVVMLRLTQIASTQITIVNDQPISTDRALDLLFQAFRLNGIGVVETDDVIMIEQLTDMEKLQPAVVLGPEVDVMRLPEDGNIVIKVFRLRHTRSSDVFDRLQGSIPSYATLNVDGHSNQLILEGDIGLAKRVQRLINLLDVPAWVELKTETFRLAYSDAQTIADNIRELFESSGSTGGARAATTRAARPQPGQRPGQAQQGAAAQPQVGTSDQLVVTVLPQTNSITVRAEPEVMENIRRLIRTAWDIPPTQDGQIFRLYDLKYTDPIKVKEVLSALLESGAGARRPAAAGGRAPAGGQAGGGADVAVANIFRIEAYPDSNRLVVISRTPDNFLWLDSLVEQIDKPLSVGLPRNIELKHANAVEVAEIINALLQQSGGGATLTAPPQGLTGIDFQSAGGGAAGAGASPQESRQEIRFPWQQARTGTDATEVSAIVGKSRVVPNAGQNSLLILATPEIQEALLEIIADLDRPGRQVMITAVLAEVELGDQLAYGVKFGPDGRLRNPSNAIGINTLLDLDRNPVLGWFDTAFLNIGVDTNIVLQALEEVTNVRILQQPRVFTSDNKEAKFFDGQDVPFQTASQGAVGGIDNLVSNFEQIAVGIGVNVRPRITRERNVAMEIAVLLSNVNNNPGFQATGGNPVINRRQTNTTITVKNGQTVVISGIRSETASEVQTKVPILGDIPLLNLLFSYRDKVEGIRELVIFITPNVMDNPDESDAFNQPDLQRLRELSRPIDESTRRLIQQAQMAPAAADEAATQAAPDAPEIR
jgi:type II secretory pathway component GspD/PulD (secretin)